MLQKIKNIDIRKKFLNHFLKTQVDELTSGVLVREDAIPLKEDITLSTECKYFWIEFGTYML